MAANDLTAGNDNAPQPTQAALKNMDKGKPCPICRKPAGPDFAPFCSDHCQKVDLNRWLSGTYVVPGDEFAPDTSDENPDY